MSGKQLVRKLLVHAVEHARAVASALIIAGYVGFFLLPLATRDNFFDENSLLVVNSVPDIWCGASLALVTVYIRQMQTVSEIISEITCCNSNKSTLNVSKVTQTPSIQEPRQETSATADPAECDSIRVPDPPQGSR